MSPTQIILLVIIGLFIALKIKKSIDSRSIPDYSAAETAQKMKTGVNVVLLDVRTAGERASRSIKGSIHIPLQEISSKVDQLNKYKDKEIICYCASGSRSVSAAIKLKKLGFKSANMLGGIGAWV